MTLVVDASVALKWVVDEPGSEAAHALAGQTMIAPPLMRVECANALWRKEDRGEIARGEATPRLALLLRAHVAFDEHATDLPVALTLAAELRHPVYDCLYLALAIRRDATLITADGPFSRVAQRSAHAARVQLLGA